MWGPTSPGYVTTMPWTCASARVIYQERRAFLRATHFNGDIIDAFYTPEYINAPDIALIARDAHRTVGTDFGVGAIVGSISARAATPTGMACSSVLPLSKAMSGTAHLPSASPGRFRCLRVIADMSIRDFVAASGAVFAAGRGFYELSKPEDVSRQVRCCAWFSLHTVLINILPCRKK